MLDPGVRTFTTGYDPSGQAIEWGKGDIGKIYRLCHAHDKIQSKRDSIHGKANKRKCYGSVHDGWAHASLLVIVPYKIYIKVFCDLAH